MNSKSVLICLSKAPQAGSANHEAIDLALAAASFDQTVGLIFEGDAALQLLPGQNPNQSGRKNLSKMLKALPIYGIEELYLYSPTVDDATISSITLATPTLKIIEDTTYGETLARFDSVIRF